MTLFLSFFRCLALSAVVMALVACSHLTGSQQKSTRSYAKATALLGNFSEAEFSRLRRDIIALRSSRFALRNSKKVAEADFFNLVYGTELSQRLSAAAALAAYGELLQALVREDIEDDLEDVAEKLADHTAVVLGDDFNDRQQKGLQQLVEGLGNFWVERKRAQAITEIVSRYQPVVAQLTALLATDLTLEGQQRGLMQLYRSEAKSLRNDSYTIINSGARYSYAERKVAADALLQAEQALQRIQRLTPKADSALQALQRANRQILQILKDKHYQTRDIKDYARKIRDMVRVYNAFAA